MKEQALTEVSFGEWLKRQRSGRGLTQEQLAHQIGCAVVTLRKIEAEERRPSTQMVERLADILNIPPNERTSFLRYARGELRYAPEESAPEAPWHASPVPPRSNLPAPSSALIGREEVIAEIHQYLTQGDIRLVTLIGPPGIGKTRLCIEAAHQSLAAFPDGVFFVSFASLDDPDLLAPTISQTLGLVETGPKSTLERIEEAIGQQQMMLILDNCEHLVEEVAWLAARLLSVCSRLKILTTSRESLRIPGEWLYSVPTLSVPEVSPSDLESALKFPALKLFVERARAVRPDFSLDPNSVRAVAMICAQLDGLPLAIELIAARVRIMSAEELLAHLNDQPTLYTDGMRALTTRQKTLNNAIGWSFDLLSAEEQKLFAQLSVFSGGFTLKAAESIFSRATKEKSIPDLIASLLDKSLLQRMSHQQEETRFSMLTVIQQFALERLRRMDMESEARNGHLAYFLALADQAEPYLTSAKRQIWVEQLKRDYDNLRAALSWSRGSETGLRLVGALRWFWEYAGMVREGRAWAEQAVQATSPANSAVRAKALWAAGSMAWLQGDYASARRWLEESEQIWRTLLARIESETQEQEARRGLARTLRKLGNVLYSEKKFIEALSLKEVSINLFREVGTRWDLALDLHILGLIFLALEDFKSARSVFSESLSLFQQEHDPWGMGVAFMDLGVMALRTNDLTDAETRFEESLTAMLQSSSPWSISRLLALLGTVAAHKGESARAVRLFGASDRLREQMGFSQHTMHQAVIENGIETVRKQLNEKEFETQLAKGRLMTMEQAIAYALESQE